MTAKMITSEPEFPAAPEEPTSLNSFADAERVFGTMVSLRSVKTGIWRRRRTWLATALLGVLIGASLHFVIPPKYAATTDVYLAYLPGSDPVQAIVNDVSLLQTRAVAGQAVSASHLHMSASALLAQYHGFALSDAIMSITANALSEHEALLEADAVAKALLAVRTDEFRLQTAVLVEGLQSQIAALTKAVNGLTTSINNASASPTGGSSNQLSELIDQRSGDASQISQLQGQVLQDQLGERTAERVSHVLNPPAIVPVSTKRAVVKDALAGLGGGLGVGLAGVILFLLLSDRPRDRATVAATVGASVELSLGRYKRPRFIRRRWLTRRLRRPSPALRMIERRLRSHLESASGSALGIIAVGAPEVSALAVGVLALSLSDDGHRVVLVDTAEGRPLASLFAAHTKDTGTEAAQFVTFSGRTLMLIVGPDDPAQMAQKAPPEDADAVLLLASLDPAFGAAHLGSWITDAVVMVIGGDANSEQMAVTGQMLRHAGIATRSVILIGADPHDETSGALDSDTSSPGASLQVARDFESTRW